jgi:hypothetical protein
MGRLLRNGVVFTLLFASVVPARAADPVLMLLLNVARELIEAQANARAKAPQVIPLPEPGRFYAGTSVEPGHLRVLIDDSFPYLSDKQRGEVYEALHAQLSDPKNAAVRATMIDFFVVRAANVRAAQQQLQQLSAREKERIASEFKLEVAALSAEEQEKLGELLRQRLLPVPNDLNQLLLSTFESR